MNFDEIIKRSSDEDEEPQGGGGGMRSNMKRSFSSLRNHRIPLKKQSPDLSMRKMENISLALSAIILVVQLYLANVAIQQLQENLGGKETGQPQNTRVAVDVSLAIHALILILGCVFVDVLVLAKMLSYKKLSIKHLTNSYQDFIGNQILEVCLNTFNIIPFTYLTTVLIYLIMKYMEKQVVVRLQVEYTVLDVLQLLYDDFMRLISFFLIRYWFVISCNVLLKN